MELPLLKTSKSKNRKSSVPTYEERFLPLLRQVESHLDRMTSGFLSVGPGQEKLLESIRYSLLSGGKRFRPVLACVIAQALQGSVLDVLPWAAAIEFIHCYSLIHDDLPCMDNDDLRRGKPSNHKVYGEGIALLAGDGLLTEAFGQLAHAYCENPATGMQLVSILGEAAGVRGMIGGQALDIWPEKLHGLTFVQSLHEMKTGALIRAAAEGAAVIADASASKRERARKLGALLGFSFQLKDDLLDFDPQNPEATNFANSLGVNGVKTLLDEVTAEALIIVEEFDQNDDLKFLVQFNSERTK